MICCWRVLGGDSSSLSYMAHKGMLQPKQEKGLGGPASPLGSNQVGQGAPLASSPHCISPLSLSPSQGTLTPSTPNSEHLQSTRVPQSSFRSQWPHHTSGKHTFIYWKLLPFSCWKLKLLRFLRKWELVSTKWIHLTMFSLWTYICDLYFNG